MRKPLIAIVILMTAQPLFAQAPVKPAPSSSGPVRPSPVNPYRNLFQPRDARPASPSEPAKAAIVCGMTVIQADPSLDSKMVSPPKGDGVKYTIRAVPPPICTAPR